MKEDDLLKKYLQENNILEVTIAYHDALLTFTFAYESRSQYANVPMHIFWR